MAKITCNECGKEINPGNTNGLPNGVGFELEDGTIYNVCLDCMMTGSLDKIKAAKRIRKGEHR